MFTEVTRLYSLCTESSSSFLSLASLTLILNGTPRTPWAQMALFRRVSILTSLVPICFSANFLISLTALGLVLEPDSMQSLVHVDRVLAGDDLAHGGALFLLTTGWHFEKERVSCRSESSNKS